MKPDNHSPKPQLYVPFAGRYRRVDFLLAQPLRMSFFMAAVVKKVRWRYIQNGDLAKNRPCGISLQMARSVGA